MNVLDILMNKPTNSRHSSSPITNNSFIFLSSCSRICLLPLPSIPIPNHKYFLFPSLPENQQIPIFFLSVRHFLIFLKFQMLPKKPYSSVFSTALFLLPMMLHHLPLHANCSPLRRHSPSHSPQFPPPFARAIRQSSQPMFGGQLFAPNGRDDNQNNNNNPAPPHCSRATITMVHSSKLTKRSPNHPNASSRPPIVDNSAATQLSLNIGIGQTVCFTMTGQNDESSREREEASEEKEAEEEIITVPKSNFSFVVELARQPIGVGKKKRPPQEKIVADNFDPNKVLHSITILDLEQYHAITERYRFAIPEVETRCICECRSSSANCAADRYKYGRCGGDEDEGQTDENNLSVGEKQNGGPMNWMPRDNRQGEQPSACYRTFFANQPTGRHCSSSKNDDQSSSSSSSSSARLCCQLRFKAHRNRAFTALQLENAVSSVLLQYSQWGWKEEGQEMGGGRLDNGSGEGRGKPALVGEGERRHWVELEKRKVRIQLDGAVHNTVLSEQAGLKLSVLGLNGANSAGTQMESGIYFAENQPNGLLGELIGQMPINRITEHDFHKLGWFRLDERGQPFVQSGDVLLDKIHHARVDDCAEQRFRSVLDASYYVNADNNASTQFKLADPLPSVYQWIRSARVLDSNQRIALVRAREGISLEVTLTASQRPSEMDDDGREEGQRRRLVTFVHNSSRLTDFTAMLVIDRFSNSMLNLMLFNASGVLNGYVRPLSDVEGAEIDGFSVNADAPNYDGQSELTVSQQIRIKPYPLGSIHIVCLRPDDAELAQELCRPVQSVYHELEVNTVRNEWNQGVGACKKCNQITAEGFAKYLNPANWTKGISSVSEALMLISDIIGYFIAILILYALLSKVIFPVLGCCCTNCVPNPAGLFCKTSKK